jgi:S-adenosylmethionine synthetase
MELKLISGSEVVPSELEVVERKGYGHPDTLSDGLAEALSRAYAVYTRDRFGAVLHHNFDKVGLLGGRAYVAFGEGRLTAPIRVLINGRATESLGDEEVPVRQLVEEASRDFLCGRLPALDPDEDLDFHHNLSCGSSPGQVETGLDRNANRGRWFQPRSLEDLREAQRLTSNDTSVGAGYWPLTSTEQLVLTLERRLTDRSFREVRSWLGTDIKVMAIRAGHDLSLTLCVPQIADAVPDAAAYGKNLEEIEAQVRAWSEEMLPGYRISLALNTKDDFDRPELYLTAIGSSIESGDEGLVGRGNRINGLIAMCRPYSMEGACGKNPVYHTGKLYGVLAIEAARRLHGLFGQPVNVWLIGQEGRQLDDPWQAAVASRDALPESGVRECLKEVLESLPKVTESLLAGEVELF